MAYSSGGNSPCNSRYSAVHFSLFGSKACGRPPHPHIANQNLSSGPACTAPDSWSCFSERMAAMLSVNFVSASAKMIVRGYSVVYRLISIPALSKISQSLIPRWLISQAESLFSAWASTCCWRLQPHHECYFPLRFQGFQFVRLVSAPICPKSSRLNWYTPALYFPDCFGLQHGAGYFRGCLSVESHVAPPL